MNKKITKIIGNCLTIVALLFLFKKMFDLDTDYTVLFTTKNLLYLILFSVLYGLHIYMVCFSWRTFVDIICKKKIHFAKMCLVLCKSNLLKYIPGNVFQYVGRNEIAVKENLKHGDVALSTVMDIGSNILGVFILGVICYSAGFTVLMNEYGSQVIKVFLIVLISTIFLVVLALCFFKKKLFALLDKLKVFLEFRNIIKVIGCVLYYTFWGLYTGLILIGVLICIVGMDFTFDEGMIIMGAFLFSWILGFVMPGAPGGVGIRETCMTILVANYMDIELVLLGIVIYRVVNIFGDLFGAALAKSTNYICVKKEKI